MKVGVETATDWIGRGKVERDVGSDGDSVYRKRSRSERRISRMDKSNTVKRSGAIDPADYTGVRDALLDKAKRLTTSSAPSSSAATLQPEVDHETDAQRLERLKKEEKERKVTERAEKKRIEQEEKEKLATPESITKDKAEQMLTMTSKAKADIATKLVKLKGNKLASSIKE
eukprot:129334-Lingulodinium_polyedra.AAC.1